MAIGSPTEAAIKFLIDDFSSVPTSGGIYVLTHDSGKFYVGSAKNFRLRLTWHVRDLRGGRHRNYHLQRAWVKYGESTFRFSVLEVVADPADLIAREQFYIDSLKPTYNICPTASSALGRCLRPETKEKIRQANLGKKHSVETKAKMAASHVGKKRSFETVEKIRLANRGKKRTPEFCVKMSLVQTGHTASLETRAKMSASLKGRKMPPEAVARKIGSKHTLESRAKMGVSRRGISLTPEHRKKISLGKIGHCKKQNGELNTRAVLNPTQVLAIRQKFQGNVSSKDLAEEYGVTSRTIRSICTPGGAWKHLPYPSSKGEI